MRHAPGKYDLGTVVLPALPKTAEVVGSLHPKVHGGLATKGEGCDGGAKFGLTIVVVLQENSRLSVDIHSERVHEWLDQRSRREYKETHPNPLLLKVPNRQKFVELLEGAIPNGLPPRPAEPIEGINDWGWSGCKR